MIECCFKGSNMGLKVHTNRRLAGFQGTGRDFPVSKVPASRFAVCMKKLYADHT